MAAPRVVDVEHALVGRKGEPVGHDEIIDQQGQLAEVRGHPVDPGKCQIPLLRRGWMGPRIGEVDAAVRFDDDIVGAIELATLKAVGDDGDAAVELLAGDAARIVLAGDEPSLQVAGQAIGAIGRLQQQRHAFARLVFHAPVVVDIAEHQMAAFAPPQRPFGRPLRAAKPVGQVVDRLRRRDDPVQLGSERLDPLGRLGHGIPPILISWGLNEICGRWRGRPAIPAPALCGSIPFREDKAMPTRNVDVVILGGGNAGMGVTVATREAGLKVVMLEPDLLGGTCPNRGCMPKKVLVAAAHALDEIERAKTHCITVGEPSLDWAALIDREKAMIAGIPGSLAGLMTRRGVEVIRGRGRFAEPNAVAVGSETLEAKHIVIATGSTPRKLPFPGAELMITSDEVLNERRLPASVVFVGGGVIALELSHVYARAGAKVTILEALPRLLGNMDADALAQLHRETERIGVAIHTGVEVRRIERAGGLLRVAYEEGGSEHTIEADRVVN